MDIKANIQQAADELHSVILFSPLHNASYDTLLQCLTNCINDLVTNNFHALIQLLYRMDISEAKLRLLLQENTNKIAANIIAKMMIERQLQKIETRRLFKQDDNIPEEEKW